VYESGTNGNLLDISERLRSISVPGAWLIHSSVKYCRVLKVRQTTLVFSIQII